MYKLPIDSSELDTLQQIVEHLERRPPASLAGLEREQLDYIKAVCVRIVDKEDLEDGFRMRAAVLHMRAVELKINLILATVKDFTPRMCRHCGKHRVSCVTCICGRFTN